jgi:hypothetical protein
MVHFIGDERIIEGQLNLGNSLFPLNKNFRSHAKNLVESQTSEAIAL